MDIRAPLAMQDRHQALVKIKRQSYHDITSSMQRQGFEITPPKELVQATKVLWLSKQTESYSEALKQAQAVLDCLPDARRLGDLSWNASSAVFAVRDGARAQWAIRVPAEDEMTAKRALGVEMGSKYVVRHVPPDWVLEDVQKAIGLMGWRATVKHQLGRSRTWMAVAHKPPPRSSYVVNAQYLRV
eukprot:133075-Amphidinium_carterae.1